MKKILSLLVISATLVFAGCQSNPDKDFYKTDEQSLKTNFNEETYIWENWFHTNDKVKE